MISIFLYIIAHALLFPIFLNRRCILLEYSLTNNSFTESAFVTAMKSFGPEDGRKDRSLGRPLRNVKCYVLSNNLKKMPIGAIGELWIGGQGVSQGYLNRPELTSERFINNPFQTEAEKVRGANQVIYKTGDLARWIPGRGEVEYLGRNDFQIKLRGVRIEPGEIESVLATYQGVERAVVVAKVASSEQQHSELGAQHLVGYFTGVPSLTESELLAFLDSKVPRYMVPTRLIRMKCIPTTINGKVDFRALPEVELTVRIGAKIRPRNDVEVQLCQIWADILRIDQSKLGVKDSFFHLGGHSITCIQLVGRVRQVMRASITVEQIFSHKTIEALADLIQQTAGVNGADANADSAQPFEPPAHLMTKDVEALYLANSLQQGFMYHHLKQGNEDSAYTMQSVYRYRTHIVPGLYEAAWKHAQQQFGSLRLRFVSDSDVIQVIDRKQKMDWRFTDLSATESQSTMARDVVMKLRSLDEAERYHLRSGMLFRIYLVKINEQSYAALFSCHHSILDGWSIPLLVDFVHETYLQLLRGAAAPVSLDTSFFESQSYLQHHRNDNVAYWTQRVDQIEERCDLRGLIRDHYRYKVSLATYDHVRTQKEKTVRLSLWSSYNWPSAWTNETVTLHSILQFVWHKVLRIYGGGRHSVTGTIVAGRNLPVDNIESAVGLFINTLPLIVDHSRQKTSSILDAVQEIQKDVIDMNSCSIVELGKIQGGKLIHSLFDSLFVLENYPSLDQGRMERHARDLKLEVQSSSEKLDYPLAVVCKEDPDYGVSVTLRYASELFEDATIDDILDTYNAIFQQVVSDIRQPVANLDFLSQRQLLQLAEWNEVEQDYPQLTLNEIFVQEAERVPDKVALIYERTMLTYREMDQLTNQLARYLRSILPCAPDTIVGLILDKTELMFLSVFAVWKAGLAYVPIDPSFPPERIQYILEETRAIGIVVNERHSSKALGISLHSPRIITIEDALGIASRLDGTTMSAFSSTTDLAYIYFTSGTTGKPKGVMIEHRGVVNLHKSLAKTFELKARDDEVILSFSNYSFDHFVEMVTDALLNGQTLLILNDEMRADKHRLYQYMADNKVTYLSGTPSVISMYTYAGLDHLRRIDCVGEDFNENVFDNIRKEFSGLIINGYGPTEVSITTHKRLYWPGQRRCNKSIGHQIVNSRTYVLDENRKRLPIGAVGELYLGGDGVGRGYLNRPELSAERFPTNPYQSLKDRKVNRDSRLYKTGDLVRWLPNGEIEYLGRDDSQIKLRGQRVELGEIEAAICSCAGISQSVVLAKSFNIPGSQNMQKFLVGYYVAPDAQKESQLKRTLQSKLPEYLIPNRLMQVKALPVTVSGKLDTKQLPDVGIAAVSEYVAPRNEIELGLCEIWGELLGVMASKISIVDDFFSLGGDSLMSTKLSFITTQRFGRSVTVATIFKHRTVESQSRYILNEASEQDVLLPLNCSSTAPPLSFSQERLAFIHDFEGGSDAYNVVKNLGLPFEISLPRLREALRRVVARHAALRTMLVTRQGPNHRRQLIMNAKDGASLLLVPEVVVKDAYELEKGLMEESRHIFRLDQAIPIRAKIFTEPGSRVLSLVLHHTAFDGWSFEILMRDLAIFYQSENHQMPASRLPVLPIQYADYCVWQRKHIRGKRMRQLTDFWLRKLDGLTGVNLATDFPRPKQFDYHGNDLQLEVGNDIQSRLHSLAQEFHISLFSVLLGVYGLVLSTYSNQKDIVIGAPMMNRVRPEIEDVVGLFINMVPIRLDVSSNSTIAKYLQAVNEELIRAQMNQEMPFEEIVKILKVENDAGRHPVFQHVFSTDIFRFRQDWSTKENQALFNLPIYKEKHFKYSSSKFDLSTAVTETDGKLVINFNYPRALFKQETIQRLMQTFRVLLIQVTNERRHSERMISGLLLQHLDSQYVTPDHDQVPQNQSSQQTLHGLFEAQLANCGQETAVVSAEGRLSFSELEVRANQIAHLLRAAGVSRGQFVAIALKRCLDTIVAILAVWKVGAAYVPLDTSYPVARLEHMLKDTRTPLIITKRSEYQGPFAGVPPLYLDDECTIAKAAMQPTDFHESRCVDNDLAYCIYTSGTTGNPKGVMVQHRSVISLRNDLRKRYFGNDISVKHAVLLLSNTVFDFSVEQFALSFLSSQKLVIPPADLSLEESFYEYMNAEDVTYVSGTPSLLSQFDLSRLKHLQMITSAGEQLNAHQFQSMRRQFKGPINNAYGITETTVYNMVRRFECDEPFSNSLGTLIAKQKLYVATEALQLLPCGAIGELYLAGVCVAAGYLNNPELTKERFLPNPFRTQQDIASNDFPTIYKTGDLVRYATSDRLEYLGRKDTQVKLRGFRVELNEINAAISSCAGVKESTVLARSRDAASSGHTDYLIGCYVSDLEAVTENTVRKVLEGCLPSHLVPARIIRVRHRLPVTINGKIDTKCLLETATDQDRSENILPRNFLEVQMCRIWNELLNTDCGVEDDFFKIGGDSILSLQLSTQIRTDLNTVVTAKDIFQFRTIARIVDSVLKQQTSQTPAQAFKTEHGLLTGRVEMLPIQEWFFAKTLAHRNHWNQCFVIRTQSLDISRLEAALDELVSHHDAFRLRYTEINGVITQHYASNMSQPVEVIDIASLDRPLHDVLTDVQASLDIQKGPTARVCYLHGYTDGRTELMFAVHHLIVDTVSWRIIARDLQTLYEGNQLGAKASSYRQWTKAVQNYSPSADEKQLWEDIIQRSRDIQTPNMPAGGPTSSEKLQLSQARTHTLIRECNRTFDTRSQELLLVALGRALQRLTGSQAFSIIVEGHGREFIDRSLDVSNTVGWFTTMYPLIIEHDEDLGQSIFMVRQNLRRIPYQGIGYGALYGYNADPPLPQISFNFLGYLSQTRSTSTAWQPEYAMGGEYGLCRSPKDAAANQTLVDITAWIVDGQLDVDLSSRLGREETKELISRLEQALNEIIESPCNLPSGVLADATSKKSTSTQRSFTPYFEFTESPRQGPLLFLLPPGEGGAESYFNNIVKEMPYTHLVVFNNYHLHDPEVNPSFESLARRYIAWMRERQRQGPFHIAGWSFGGVLSLEICRQLTIAGEKIATLALIDPYFNVKQACAEIGLPNEADILDPINYHYQPDTDELQGMARENIGRLVLFKAPLMNEKARNPDQSKLFEHYMRSECNALDTLLDRERIQLVELGGDTHFTWVNHRTQVRSMCKVLLDCLAP